MSNRAGVGRMGRIMAAAVVSGAAMAILSGTAGAASATDDNDGVIVLREPGHVQTWAGQVWALRGCSYGPVPPHVGLSCQYEIQV